ncbi:unnamed protein product [Nezara viridula]|uniref:Uncharacterized protein n=1 Tax=Nezara viridula TaxID=85310 RepID=A0A9P0E0I9_NEZVI|nr:unnamed protein product [Nezara viridula]
MSRISLANEYCLVWTRSKHGKVRLRRPCVNPKGRSTTMDSKHPMTPGFGKARSWVGVADHVPLRPTISDVGEQIASGLVPLLCNH